VLESVEDRPECDREFDCVDDDLKQEFRQAPDANDP
jgi:hypothetical protein